MVKRRHMGDCRSSVNDLEQLIQALRDNDANVPGKAEDQLKKNISDKGLESSLGDSLIQTLKENDVEVRTRAEGTFEDLLNMAPAKKNGTEKFNCSC